MKRCADKRRRISHSPGWTDSSSSVLFQIQTTFFASTEAGMLQVTIPSDGTYGPGLQVANSAFTASLLLHAWAAMLSFLGAFFVVRYRLTEAKEEEKEVTYASSSQDPRALSRSSTDLSILRSPPTRVWTTNPHLEAVGPFERKPPTHLLAKIHNLCILLTFFGFALALLGILAFAWEQNPLSVGVVASVSTAVCLGATVWVFL
ncbi:hypothetical protein C8F01DRAFT_1104878 [Mycena amicta]|nr:hypothetical protein C8F01DRAFT_1104878 [Mycena amicta]